MCVVDQCLNRFLTIPIRGDKAWMRGRRLRTPLLVSGGRAALSVPASTLTRPTRLLFELSPHDHAPHGPSCRFVYYRVGREKSSRQGIFCREKRWL